jgi:hypothetical protein
VRLEAELAKIQAMVEAWRNRVKAHVLICMLACYLAWHLRTAWAPLTCTDEHPPLRANPSPPPINSAAQCDGPGAAEFAELRNGQARCR